MKKNDDCGAYDYAESDGMSCAPKGKPTPVVKPGNLSSPLLRSITDNRNKTIDLMLSDQGHDDEPLEREIPVKGWSHS